MAAEQGPNVLFCTPNRTKYMPLVSVSPSPPRHHRQSRAGLQILQAEQQIIVGHVFPILQPCTWVSLTTAAASISSRTALSAASIAAAATSSALNAPASAATARSSSAWTCMHAVGV
jgi:hypothetical protein